MPDYNPQLASLVKAPPEGDDWVHEIKYDGYRIGCLLRRGAVTLISRNGKDWTAAFPDITRAAASLRADEALLDGEVAMVLPDGKTSFQALQNGGVRAAATLVYFAFDLLRLDGERLERLPLEQRKDRLRRLLGRRATGRLRYADHVEGSGREFFDHACRLGLEGIISKRRGRPYLAGKRGGDWLKTKCILRQEFVIGGFTDPEGARSGLGALLIGTYEPAAGAAAARRLVFNGRVGTGFSQQVALDLRRRLDAIEQKSSPFDPPPTGPLSRRAYWVAPRLVCDVAFTEWTSDGKIRHPSFQGLRADKKPAQVVRERPGSP